MTKIPRARIAVAAVLGAAPALLPALGASASTPAPSTPEPAAGTPFCSTTALSPANLKAGHKSVVRCYATNDEALLAVNVDPKNPTLAAARKATAATAAKGTMSVRSGLIGVHYMGYGATGSLLAVAGTDCEGSGLSFNAGDYWNDKIASTRHKGCGQIKHFVDNTYSGTNQITSGDFDVVVDMNWALVGRTSSILYYPPYN